MIATPTTFRKAKRTQSWWRCFTLLLILSIATILSSCNQISNDASEQENVVRGFYEQHLKAPFTGVPSMEELKPLQTFFSRALFALLTQVSEFDQAYRANADKNVPPLIDGDLFSSLFEGPTTFTIESCTTKKDKALCDVTFTHSDTTIPSESWVDEVLLVKEEGHWRIDDIEFSENDSSSRGEYLTDTLNDIINPDT